MISHSQTHCFKYQPNRMLDTESAPVNALRSGILSTIFSSVSADRTQFRSARR